MHAMVSDHFQFNFLWRFCKRVIQCALESTLPISHSVFSLAYRTNGSWLPSRSYNPPPPRFSHEIFIFSIVLQLKGDIYSIVLMAGSSYPRLPNAHHSGCTTTNLHNTTPPRLQRRTALHPRVASCFSVEMRQLLQIPGCTLKEKHVREKCSQGCDVIHLSGFNWAKLKQDGRIPLRNN